MAWSDKRIESNTPASPDKKLITYEINSMEDAKKVVLLLMHGSRWFELTPLPEDRWDIVVKDDAILDKVLRDLKIGFRRR